MTEPACIGAGTHISTAHDHLELRRPRDPVGGPLLASFTSHAVALRPRLRLSSFRNTEGTSQVSAALAPGVYLTSPVKFGTEHPTGRARSLRLGR